MTESENSPYKTDYDLSNCDAEPIHFIRHYQLPAFMLLVDPKTMLVKAHSSNFPGLTTDRKSFIGKPMSEVLDKESAEHITQFLTKGDYQVHNPLLLNLTVGEVMTEVLNVVLNPSGEDILLEFEPREEKLSSSAFLLRIDQALHQIQNSGHSENLFERVVNEVKALTDYDRVMLYKFDQAYNGEVVAEAKNENLEPFLHLRYPHTDIPEQARKMFLRKSVRHIVNSDLSAISVIVSDPAGGEVDLTYCANRGTSPIHLQYLQNMNVGASLTIGLIVNQKLWGLVSCHHGAPKMLDYRLRSIIGLLGKVLSGHLALQETEEFRNKVLGISITRSRLFERMTEKYNIVEGLLRDESPNLQDLTAATGAALLLDGEIYQSGETPTKEEISTIVAYLDEKQASLYASERFFEELPAARNYAHPPAGVLSIRLTRQPAEYVLWFRPEVRKTVEWGGRPDQRKRIKEGKVELHPELSFLKWVEQVEGRSATWETRQQDAASSLRNDIKEVILQKYQEARRLNGELVDAYQELESFSYTVSHDLRAPLRNIKSFAEILQEDYDGQLDDFGQEALRTIVSSVGRMNSFINDILEFSRFSQAEVAPLEVALDSVIDDVWLDLKHQTGQARFQRQGGGVVLMGDFIQLKQLVQNILSNAFKYSSKVAQPEVVLKSSVEKGKAIIEVSDNGIGMEMKHAERIFTVFNRLVSKDQYEGTGVGLAIAKNIVEKHNGEIRVNSEPGKGTTFTIVLPTGLNLSFDAITR